jgi:putative transposase
MIHLDRQRSLDLFEQALDPTDDSLRKIINLATVELMKKWNHAVQNWYMCLTQLAIQFPERVPLDLAL